MHTPPFDFRFFLAIAFACCLSKIEAQPANKYVTDAVMPAPNAGSLGKYGDIPVNLFTGVPDISIPIHTLQEGPLSLPVSLSYHASGIKAGEMASWVGMGWSLNAGGVITRTVQGIPDETAVYGYYANAANLPATFDQNLQVHRDLLREIGLGYIDTEPDIFTFNVGGYSGKFWIDHDEAPAQGGPAYNFVPRQDIKLEFNPTFTKFTIVGTDGTRYTFGEAVIGGSTVTAREYTHQFGQPASKTYCSSWYLLKVESADLKYSINLSYTTEYYAYWNYAPCKRYEFSIINCPDPQNNGSEFECAPTGIDTYHKGFITEIEGQRLQSITTSAETIDFTATVNRLDLDPDNLHTFNAKRLENIDIKSGSPQVACRRFGFTYDYFQDTTTSNNTSLYKRLRLKTVQESACSGTTITLPPYEFVYNGNFLPWRMSKAVDHWGYYNGSLTNESLLVSVPPTTMTVPGSTTTITYGSANREPDGNWVKKGVLTEIKYPTGGKTKFVYEPNEVRAMVTTPTLKLHLYSCPGYIGNCCGTKTNTSGPIQFTQAELGNSPKFKIGLSDIPGYIENPPPSCSNANTVACSVQAFRSSDNAPVGPPYSFNLSDNPENVTVWTNDILLSFLQGSLTFQPNTNYKFTITTTHGYGQLKVNSYSTALQNKTVGGLRIKEVRSHDGISTSNDLVKTYEYLEEGSTTASSGVLYKTPIYGHNIEGIAHAEDNVNTDGYYQMMFTEQSMTPLFSFDGFLCGYKRVRENHNGNGYKVYNFIYEPTNPPGYSYPQYPDKPSFTLGKMEQERTYNASNTLKASTSYQGGAYGLQLNTGPLHKVITIPFTCKVYDFGERTLIYMGYRIVKYVMISGLYRLDVKTEMLDGVSTTTNHEYGNFSQHFMPTADVVTNSDGKVTRTEYKYVHDYASGAIRAQLLARNIIRAPYEVITKVNGTITNGHRITYACYTHTGGFYSTTLVPPSGGHVRPYTFKNYEMTWVNGTATPTSPDPWILKGTINTYNTLGEPASFTTANWPYPETYTWNTTGLILTRTYQNHQVVYDYYPGTRLLRTIEEIDDRKTGFTYDKLMRLTKVTKDNASINSSTGEVVEGNVKIEYTYHYKEPSPGDQNNWIKTKTTYNTIPGSGSNLTSVESFEYLDGLGRSLQTVKKAWSPTQKDVVSAVLYDNQGRVVRQYTPFMTTTNTGALAAVPASQPYTLSEYYADPLNRVWKTTPPGWYATTSVYGANASSEVGYMNGSSATSYYALNSLAKTTVTTPQSDSVSIETITWTDKKGRSVLTSRRQAGSSTNKADTYTLYDDKNRVIRVLPPGVGTGTSDAGLRFEYAYDAADRMTSKKMPDMAAVTMKYNHRDQLVLAQDGNLLAVNKWLLTKYDDYGRPISSGVHTGANPDPNSTSLTFSEQHTATTYGTSGVELGKVKTTQTWIPGSGSITRTFTYDAVTGRLLTDNGANHLNNNTGSDNYTFAYDFAGNRLTETRLHKTSTSASTLTLTTRNTYDHAGRNTGLYHKINTNAEKQLAGFTYDFRDRLIDKGLGAVSSGSVNSFLQSVDYAYNDLDWLTSINGSSSFSALSQRLLRCAAPILSPRIRQRVLMRKTPTRMTFSNSICTTTAPASLAPALVSLLGSATATFLKSYGKPVAVSGRDTRFAMIIWTGSPAPGTSTSAQAAPPRPIISIRKTSVTWTLAATFKTSSAMASTKPLARPLAGPWGK